MSSPFPGMPRKLVKEPFHDPKLLASIWGQPWGADNSVGRIERVLMHRPGEEVLKLHEGAGQIESGPLLLNRIRGRGSQDGSGGLPNLDLLQLQHDGLTSALKEGVRVIPLEGPADAWRKPCLPGTSGWSSPAGWCYPASRYISATARPAWPRKPSAGEACRSSGAFRGTASPRAIRSGKKMQMCRNFFPPKGSEAK